ncbi:MAG: ATP-dependent zinc metalloprotease FtsH [Clostridiales bacterium]|nr:ATP-dependent zinc metalloprotease FtsH [Clostridiales bacterium]MDO4350112.1 ATP-dependent zinc metalloprotease FtsH [Eubacteriales bacterium]MDY4008786.1 ATP-dependent zinc metalloprotease FtsH [Candidatus Limiplasma sp.]
MKVENKSPKKPLIFYYLIAMLVLMLLNALVFPLLFATPVTEVGYNDFLSMIDAKQVDEVAMEEDQIIFTSKDENGQVTIFKTGRWPDESLVDRLYASGAKFSTAIPTQDSPLLTFLASWVFPILFFVVIGQLLGRMLTKRMGGNAMQFGKSNAKIYVESQTGKTFADVAGQDEAKEALTEIVDFLHNPDKYKNIGASLPKGALLVGPPGTGKTLLAKAVAGEAKVPFFSISGSEFVEMFVGMGAAKVRDLFKQAAEKAPCIVFIDEIDTIGKKRDSGAGMGGNDEREQTLNQLLTEMDGFDGTKGVVILAATNRPESLDKALLRPGRFDRRIPVELPDLQGRIAILKVHAKDVKMDANVDFGTIGRATSGASGAELANIINEAALRAVRMGRDTVNQTDLEESVEVVIAGYQRKGAVINEHEKRIIAYHEIGHALVAARQKDSAPVHKITIIPRTSGALGYTMQIEEDERVLMSKEDMLNQLTTLTGGRAAEEVVFNSITSGASNDIEKATQTARAMITRYGMSEQFGMVALETVNNPYLSADTSLACSAETSARVDAEVQSLIGGAHKKAVEILENNRELMDELAKFLLEKETITGEEFMQIVHEYDGRVKA